MLQSEPAGHDLLHGKVGDILATCRLRSLDPDGQTLATLSCRREPIPRASRFLRTAALIVALAIAAWLAFACCSDFLKVECQVYRAFVDSPPVADDIFARPPWFAAGDADLVEALRDSGPASRVVLVSPPWALERPSPCVTSWWRQAHHLPPRWQLDDAGGLLDRARYSLNQYRELDPFCVEAGLRNAVERDLIEYRIATLARDPDFLRPLITAWLASTVQACCIFMLVAWLCLSLLVGGVVPLGLFRAL